MRQNEALAIAAEIPRSEAAYWAGGLYGVECETDLLDQYGDSVWLGIGSDDNDTLAIQVFTFQNGQFTDKWIVLYDLTTQDIPAIAARIDGYRSMTLEGLVDLCSEAI